MFRCRKHRQPVQLLLQVTNDGDGHRTARPLEGNFREGALVPGGFIFLGTVEVDRVPPGLVRVGPPEHQIFRTASRPFVTILVL